MSQTERKMSEWPVEKRHKGKKITIQEVKEEDDNSNDESNARETGEII